MVYNPSRLEALLPVTPALETKDQSSRASTPQAGAKAASSDALLRLLNGTSANGSFEILEKFVDHLKSTGPLRGTVVEQNCAPSIEWDLAEEAIVHCTSIEQAIGRTLVVADQINKRVATHDGRNTSSSTVRSENPASVRDEDPFFSFSVVDSLPDFGDQSRYRSKLAKRVGRMLRPRRDIEAAVAS
jgi:hypothetical protein